MSPATAGQLNITIASEAPERAADARQAIDLLERGNRAFAGFPGEGDPVSLTLGPDAVGLQRSAGETLPQEPFAAALGCSDARVPLEQVVGCGANDIFVTRVAGNIPGSDVVGSLHYSMAHMPTVQAVFVIGHTGCGAVTAAVDADLDPNTYAGLLADPQLRGIVDAILPSVRVAALALETTHGPEVAKRAGYRAALIELAIQANAALTAMTLDADLDRDVFFCVYDLDSRTVGTHGAEGWKPGFAPAPATGMDLYESLLAAATDVMAS